MTSLIKLLKLNFQKNKIKLAIIDTSTKTNKKDFCGRKRTKGKKLSCDFNVGDLCKFLESCSPSTFWEKQILPPNFHYVCIISFVSRENANLGKNKKGKKKEKSLKALWILNCCLDFAFFFFIHFSKTKEWWERWE